MFRKRSANTHTKKLAKMVAAAATPAVVKIKMKETNRNMSIAIVEIISVCYSILHIRGRLPRKL